MFSLKAAAWLVSVLASLGSSLVWSDTVPLSYTTDDHAHTITVTNNAQIPVTATLITVLTRNTKTIRTFVWFDSYINRNDKSLGSGESRSLPLPYLKGSAGQTSVSLDAALFADGSSVGTPGGIAVLTGRRKELAQAIDAGEALLADLRAQHVDYQGLQARLDQTYRQEKLSAPTMEERAIKAVRSMMWSRLVYEGALVKPTCGGACLDRQISFFQKDLDRWRAGLTTALSEHK
jgi:hypothetical protein